MTPLMAAIMWGKNEIALWIIENRGGHNLEMRSYENACGTALCLACGSAPLSVVQALVAAGASTEGNDWSSPLDEAIGCGRYDVVEFLLPSAPRSCPCAAPLT